MLRRYMAPGRQPTARLRRQLVWWHKKRILLMHDQCPILKKVVVKIRPRTRSDQQKKSPEKKKILNDGSQSNIRDYFSLQHLSNQKEINHKRWRQTESSKVVIVEFKIFFNGQ